MTQLTVQDLNGDDDRARSELVVSTLVDAFDQLMRASPDAFRRKFRTMARDPFAFYRGSAALFYADVDRLADPWVDEQSSRVWIQGDLHAENFGTYMDSDGRLVFDVNDFDEAYLGHWTWDVQRFVASLALLCWSKALPDEVIDDLVERFVRAYVDQVHHYVEVDDDTTWALTLETGRGAVLDALHRAKLASRVALLDRVTVVEDHRRRFADGSGVRRLQDAECAEVTAAFAAYRDTVPTGKIVGKVAYDVLDLVGKSGFGIGSAGLPAYNVLIEAFSQALDNDVVLTLKQGNVAAPSRVVHDPELAGAFEHHGHRTAVSQRALQAHSDRFLGWTSIDLGSGQVGFVVAEYSPYEADLEWQGVDEPDELAVLVEQLGRATAKVHCVSDSDADAGVVQGQVEEAIARSVGDGVDDLVRDMRLFAHKYAARARADHRLFVDAFRAGAFASVAPHRP
ncbi:MAG TPA: DUF2252 domain-containing protein [Actinomycetales bacterium]